MSNPNWTEFAKQNPHDWEATIKGIFPVGVPQRARWENPEAIQAVLAHLCAKEGVHYTMLPSGGGLDLRNVLPYGEGLSEFVFQSPWVGKIATLSFESITSEEFYPWAYFMLTMAELPAQESAPVSGYGYYQSLTETSPGEYGPPASYEPQEEYVEAGRGITLLLKGKLIITGKRTHYNQVPGIDLAPQELCDEDEFRGRLEEVRRAALLNPNFSYQDVKAIFHLP